MKKPHKKYGRSNFSIEQQIAYDNHLFAVADINQTRIESFDRGFEEGNLSHLEIALKHGVELQVVNEITDKLK